VKHRFGPDHGYDKLRKENSNHSISNYSNMCKKSFGDRISTPAAHFNGKAKRPAANRAGASGRIAGAF
jgi:hypothetical protein